MDVTERSRYLDLGTESRVPKHAELLTSIFAPANITTRDREETNVRENCMYRIELGTSFSLGNYRSWLRIRLVAVIAATLAMRPGKAPVSCIPCAKRKVRCDKQLPCCHCKRRPQDTCQYPTPISAPEKSAHDLDERVRELERYVRRFDGDPKAANGEASGYPTPNSATHLPARTREPESRSFQALVVEADAPGSTSGLVADDAGTAYIETCVFPSIGPEFQLHLPINKLSTDICSSPMWYSFGEIEQPEDVSPYSHPKGMALPPSSARTSYRPSIIDPANDPSRSYVDAPQLPTTHIDFLWKTFLKNVHPLTKIFFDWEVEPIVLKARDAEASLSKVDRALIFSIVLKSVNSLTEDECTLQLHDDQARLFDRFQRATEDALRNVSYALTTNKTTLQAFMLYLVRATLKYSTPPLLIFQS